MLVVRFQNNFYIEAEAQNQMHQRAGFYLLAREEKLDHFKAEDDQLFFRVNGEWNLIGIKKGE